MKPVCIQEMMDMRINEKVKCAEYTDVIRVPGGWVYVSKSNSRIDSNLTSIFVPKPTEPLQSALTSNDLEFDSIKKLLNEIIISDTKKENKLKMIKDLITDYDQSRSTTYSDELGYSLKDYFEKIKKIVMENK